VSQRYIYVKHDVKPQRRRKHGRLWSLRQIAPCQTARKATVKVQATVPKRIHQEFEVIRLQHRWNVVRRHASSKA